jgi:hypothetical protein
MKLQELLKESQSYSAFIANSYANGFDDKPLEAGEMIITDDGNDAEFMGITPDGKKIIVKVSGCTPQKMNPADFGIKIVVSGQKP